MEPPTVIAGTGRSGSGFISKCLRHVGVNCGHEEWWRIAGSWNSEVRPAGLDADSSWLVIPHLAEYSGRVFVQLRDPLAVYGSLNNGELQPANPFAKFYLRHTPGATGEWQTDSVKQLVHWWTVMLTHAEEVWRVEDVDADEFERIAGLFDVTDADFAGAVETHHGYNKHSAYLKPTWADLPDIPETEELRELADRFGY